MEQQQAHMKKLMARTIALTLLAFAVFFVILHIGGNYKTAPASFTLTGHDGTQYASIDDPKYKLIFFGFTQCADICPVALENMRTVFDRLGTANTQIHPIYITVDPERDTPELLKTYVSTFGPELTGLTGTQTELDAVFNLFSVYARKILPSGSERYIMDHTAHIYFMGKNDIVLEVFDYNMPAHAMADKIKRHIP